MYLPFHLKQGFLLPGNVRELENCITHAVSKRKSDIVGLDCLPPWITEDTETQLVGNVAAAEFHPGNLTALQATEADKILQVLGKFDWSVNGKLKAAESLGISLSTLYRKIKAYGLDVGSRKIYCTANPQGG